MTGGKKLDMIRSCRWKKTLPILIKRTHSLLSHITNSLQAVRGAADSSYKYYLN